MAITDKGTVEEEGGEGRGVGGNEERWGKVTPSPSPTVPHYPPPSSLSSTVLHLWTVREEEGVRDTGGRRGCVTKSGGNKGFLRISVKLIFISELKQSVCVR